MPDPAFSVKRGSAVISSGSASLTLTEGVDFTLTDGIASDAWFARIVNSHHTGMGRTASGGNQNADDVTVSLSYSGDDVVFTRYGTANNCRVDWEVIEYIGAVDGPNEIKVREKGTRSIASGSATDSFALPGSVASSADVIPFITGQRTSSTGRNNYNRGLFTSDISGGNVAFNRGTSGSTATVSYAVVEFTGSNWSITKQSGDTRSGTNQTVTLNTALNDFTTAWLHSTYRYITGGTVGLDDASERVRLISNTQLNYWSSTGTDAGNKHHIVWIAENPDQTVFEYTGTMAGTGEEEIVDVSITAVTDEAQTSVMITNDSTGGGTAFPRGYINAILLDADTVRIRQSDNGQTSDYSILVIEWPEDESASPGASLEPESLSAAPQIDSPNLDQDHSLGPSEVSAASVVDQAGISQAHALSGADVAAVGDVDHVSLTETHVLSVPNLGTGSQVDQPDTQQAHALVSTDIDSISVVGLSVVTQAYALTAADTTAASSIEQPLIGGSALLEPNQLPAGSSVEGTDIEQDHSFISSKLASASDVGAPNLNEAQGFASFDISVTSLVEEATLSQEHSVDPVQISANTQIDAAILSQDQGFTIQSLGAASLVDLTSLSSTNGLSPQETVTLSSVEESGVTQAHALSCGNVVSNAFVETPMFPSINSFTTRARISTGISVPF